MPFLIFGDSFSRTTGLGSEYVETGFVNFETNGYRALLPDTAVAYQYPGGTGFYAAAARALMNTVDPKIYVPLDQFTTTAPTVPTQRLRYQITLTMPDVLPSPPDELWAGVVFLAENSSSQAGREFLYYIDQTGNHSLRLGERLPNGTFIEHLPGRRDLSASGKELGPGDSATLFVEVIFNNYFVYDVSTWWDPSTVVSTGTFVEDPYTQAGISYPFVPITAIPPGSGAGLGPDSLEFFGGFIAYQEGPASAPVMRPTSQLSGLPQTPGVSTPPLLQEFLLLDDFRISDERPFTGEGLYPVPSVTPEPVLSPIAVPGEGDPTGTELTIQPSFSVSVSEAWRTRELRSDDGTVESFPIESRPRRAWSFAWIGLPETERDTLRGLLISAEGTVKDFTWTDPETSESVQVRCSEAPSFEQVGGRVWNARALVQEIF